MKHILEAVNNQREIHLNELYQRAIQMQGYEKTTLEQFQKQMIKWYIQGRVHMVSVRTFCDKRYGLPYNKYIKGYSNWFSKPMGEYKKRRVCLATGDRKQW